MAAAVDSPVQFVFDRTASAGVVRGQYLAVSLSAANQLLAGRPDQIGAAHALGLAHQEVAQTSLADPRIDDERKDPDETIACIYRAATGFGNLR